MLQNDASVINFFKYYYLKKKEEKITKKHMIAHADIMGDSKDRYSIERKARELPNRLLFFFLE